MDNAADARAVGRKGQEHVRSVYNPAAVARLVLARLERIQELIKSGKVAGTGARVPAAAEL